MLLGEADRPWPPAWPLTSPTQTFCHDRKEEPGQTKWGGQVWPPILSIAIATNVFESSSEPTILKLGWFQLPTRRTRCAALDRQRLCRSCLSTRSRPGHSRDQQPS